jgi:putative endonuclease
MQSAVLCGGSEKYMYHVYVLKSLKNGKRYVGFTKQKAADKLEEHNQSSATWTRKNKPFVMIHYESFESKALALKREKFLKTGDGRKVLANILRNKTL